MKRALDLARRGAGLVSPNPMVGALLVNNGRVVGEGYHQYELFKHAELYAIEGAGELSRGATLYCSLEPCCHHGRTPPCTDALIEAGIARAVVACLDPYPRVSGKGIDQLRSAGIEVEVGLCQSEALRLNECYIKYVTRGVPFTHSVIEAPGDDGRSIREWRPSRHFLDTASEYDAIVIGDCMESNASVLKACMSRHRHRPLIVVGTRHDLRQAMSALGMSQEIANTSLVVLESDRLSLEGLANELAQLRALSLILMPHSTPCRFDDVDKMTLVCATKGKGSLIARPASLHPGIDLHRAETHEAGDYIEITGYPRH